MICMSEIESIRPSCGCNMSISYVDGQGKLRAGCGFEQKLKRRLSQEGESSQQVEGEDATVGSILGNGKIVHEERETCRQFLKPPKSLLMGMLRAVSLMDKKHGWLALLVLVMIE